eukprot:TRINITY_DN13122_c1_g3_i2.p1 TRINITY_DN13122_c1_g3~~TRINITY_DN13122_c1_g3_i2.p1  ORF type:complete len:875 (-),score=179.93 TRINITY_DN13122_c1_g3_i2:338-2962(-)
MVHFPWHPTMPSYQGFHPLGAEDDDTSLALRRDLLKSQLEDLDTWVTQARRREPTQEVTPPPDEEESIPPPPGVENLLRAQLQEIEKWLTEVRRTNQEDQDAQARLQPTSDAAVLLALGRQRAASRRRPLEMMANSDAATQHRREAVRAALACARKAETQRTLALQQVESLRLQSKQEWSTIRSQFNTLHNDPLRAPELCRYTTTDLALTFVGAIEQRRSLMRDLSQALQAREELQKAAQGYEQLLTCAAEEALQQEDPAIEQSLQGCAAMAAPAARLMLDGRDQIAEVHKDKEMQTVQAERVFHMAQRNVKLWEELSSHWLNTRSLARSREKDPLRHQPAAFQVSELQVRNSPVSPRSALHSELHALRVQEGRLDALLDGSASGSKAGRLAEPETGPSAQGGWVFGFGIEQYFDAWSATAKEFRIWKRQRRLESAQHHLNKRGPAMALWCFSSRLQVVIEKPLPALSQLKRGQKVRELSSGNVGMLLSSTPQGVCKVSLEGDTEPTLLPAIALSKIEVLPHKFLSYLSFLAWAVAVAREDKLRSARFRAQLLTGRMGGKAHRTLTRLASIGTEPLLAARLCFDSWHSSLKAKETKRLKHLDKFFQAWHHDLLQAKHSRAVEELQMTTEELQSARRKAVQASQSIDRFKARLQKLDVLETQLWGSWVLSAWSWVRRSRKIVKSERIRCAEVASRVCDAADKRSQRVYFRAWSHAVALVRKANRAAEAFREVLRGASDLVAPIFAEWKALCKELSRERELDEVKELTQELYCFAKEAAGRAKKMESALLAADRALQAGASHSDTLEREVLQLSERLRHQQAALQAPISPEDEQRKHHVEQQLRSELKDSEAKQARLQHQLAEARSQAAASKKPLG